MTPLYNAACSVLAGTIIAAGLVLAMVREADASDRFYDCGRQWIARGLDVPVYVVPVRDLIYSVCQTPARACYKPAGTLAIPHDSPSIWIDATRQADAALEAHEIRHLGGLAGDHTEGGPTSCELGRPGPNDLVDGGAQ